ncbi:MAG: outer membrane lipoprotein chaperone LolA [Bryobacterales bacterium]|nr:outer membrane lipoprotein chaperone LolA [Bryobacterales bacterium]
MVFLLLLISASGLTAAGFDLMPALKKVEDRYNNVRTLELDFSQTMSFLAQPTAKRTESGVLYLRKPGKMRWDYQQPSKKVFLSDGKDVYFYTPAANRMERSKLKETEDMRAPLAFLLGRLDFNRDFREYRVREENGGHWIVAKPKSDKAPYKEVEFLLLPDSRIGRLRVLGQDESLMEFTFRNERLNPPIDDKLFHLDVPQGVEVVEVAN